MFFYFVFIAISGFSNDDNSKNNNIDDKKKILEIQGMWIKWGQSGLLTDSLMTKY